MIHRAAESLQAEDRLHFLRTAPVFGFEFEFEFEFDSDYV
jgi:hypothetical protein